MSEDLPRFSAAVIHPDMTMTGAIMSNRLLTRRTAAGATAFALSSLLSLDLTRGCRVR